MAPRKRKKRAELLPAQDVVAIVADGALAGPVAEGANIPLVILDTTDRPDLEEMIRVQAYLPPGDVTFRWGGVDGKPDDVLLMLEFARPVETRAVLRFSIEAQGILIETALAGHGIYLQAGRPGDRLRDDLEQPKMLVELPETGFRPVWNTLYRNRVADVLRVRHRVRQEEALVMADELIRRLRTLTGFRMPRQ